MTLEKCIIEEILYEGLGNSTWRDNFPEAYNALLKYAEDMENTVREVIKKENSG